MTALPPWLEEISLRAYRHISPDPEIGTEVCLPAEDYDRLFSALKLCMEGLEFYADNPAVSFHQEYMLEGVKRFGTTARETLEKMKGGKRNPLETVVPKIAPQSEGFQKPDNQRNDDDHV